MFINKHPPKEKYISITDLEYRLSNTDRDWEKRGFINNYRTEYGRIHEKCRQHGIKITIIKEYLLLEYLGKKIKYFPRTAKLRGIYKNSTPAVIRSILEWKEQIDKIHRQAHYRISKYRDALVRNTPI